VNRSVAQVLKDALKLPAEARAAIACPLIGSVEDDADENAEALWSSEIARRMAEIDDGSAQLVPWAEVHRRLSQQRPKSIALPSRKWKGLSVGIGSGARRPRSCSSRS